MKAVMISIQPKWCELIASGKKTVEVRKTMPNIATPFKCYIYCTQGKLKDIGITSHSTYENRQKVIGEFVCDELSCGYWISPFTDYLQRQSCLSYDEICDYANEKPLFAWHISDLVIYDEPKELWEFIKPCNHENDCCTCDRYDYIGHRCYNEFTRPPQSWCYVEERSEGK